MSLYYAMSLLHYVMMLLHYANRIMLWFHCYANIITLNYNVIVL